MLIANLLIDLCLMALPKRSQNAVTGLVRLDAIGDFVVWLPAAEALLADLRARKRRVVLIANQLWAPWAKTVLAPDDIVAVDMLRFGSDLRYRLAVLKRVRDLKLGEIILPTYSRIPGDGNDAIAFSSGARNRIGNLGYRSRNKMAGALRSLLNLGYSKIVPADTAPRAGRTISEAENNAAFLQGVGLPATARVGRLPLAVDVDLSPLNLPDSPYAVLIPGGSFFAKAWPVERFAEVGRELKASGLEVLISGSSGEHELCEHLAIACGGCNIAGKTSLPALGEVIRRAQLVVGNDSAGMHIAVAAGTNSLCVMWGGSFGRFIPYAPEFLPEGLFARAVYNRMDCFGCTGACSLPSVQGKLPCIATIPVSAVLSSLKEILRDDCATAVQSLPTSSPETTPPA